MIDQNRLTHTLFFLLLLCLLTAPLAAQAPRCADTAWIEPGDTVRGLGTAAGEPDCFRLQAPGPGLLMVDVAVAGGAEPRLALTPGCGGGKALPFRGPASIGTLAASPSHRLVKVAAAGSFLACVGAQDPLLRLDDFRLATAFVPSETDKDEPIEVEPDGLVAGPGCWREKDEPIEVEPDGLTLVAGSLEALCRQTRRDEHADLFPCAERLVPGRVTRGEIANAWGDDADVFAFELARMETVRLELSGDAAAIAGLHDSRGQRLAPAGDESFRRVQTLGPGVYFVRVQGRQGSEGAYALELAVLPRSW